MINLFYDIQTYMIKKHPKVLSKITYRIIFFLMRSTVPWYYKINVKKNSGVSVNADKILISLTSFPQRIDKVWIVLESLMRQTKKPDKIILWLAKSQFPTKSMLPNSVLRFEKRGLEIRFVEDLKSHKKYYYAVKEYPDYNLITVDDDLFYPERMVENLYKKHLKYPKAIVCNRVHLMTFNKENLNSYNDWRLVYQGDEGPNSLFFPTNGAGTFFPKKSLSPSVLDVEIFMNICQTADDIWLKCMSYIAGTEIVKVEPYFCEMYSVFKPSDGGLQEINVVNKKNDEQLRNVMDYYEFKIGKNV